MSMYNMLFGEQPASRIALSVLGITPDDVPRYRDAYFGTLNDKPVIVIHTRTGGGNRDYYDSPECSDSGYEGPWNSTLRALPGFIHDADDDYDSTYADFYFEVPEELREDVSALLKGQPPVTPSEKWQALLAMLAAKGLRP